MKELKKNEVAGIQPINEELCDEMFVHELEKRLETDPLLANGLLDLVTTMNASSEDADLLCWTCDYNSCNRNG